MKNKFHCGIKIRQLRQIKALTQFQLGEKIGKTQALVSYIEKTGKINEHLLVQIAEFFNVSLESLLTLDDEMSNKKFNQNITKDKLYIQLKEEIDFLKKVVFEQNEIIKKILKSK
jgi:transcriptional regulator with XRE-family HTH domain